MNVLRKSGHRPDYFLLTLVVILTLFGLAMLASASSELGKIRFNDSYYYLKHQALFGLSLGVIGFLAASFFRYQYLKKFALPFLIINLIALVLVFTSIGLEARNANRWLKIGPLSFQPAESMKLVFILYLAAWLSNTKIKRTTKFLEGFLPFGFISGLIAILLVLQPATSTVVILLGSGLIVYILDGAKLRYILLIVLVGIIGVAIIIQMTPYRKARILSFFNKTEDVSGNNYQVSQALIAIGSGGLMGKGYGESSQKVDFLPASIDDSIFAIISEELGFIGAGTVVMLFGMLSFRMFYLAHRLRDNFGRLILIGFGSVIAFQSLMHMASISGMLPLTGVPLPFISYGGTALAVFLTMSGVAVNVSKYT
ncbi:MAG: putative peptidoglycan glycosyltransferase FtsW [Patescibacteria group bacterium]